MFGDDTIAAVSTPPGEGGIGIVRLSGKDAINITDRLFHSPKGKKLSGTASHRIVYGFINDPYTDETIDEVLISVMRSPNTYTREDIVEINCHGGMLPLRDVLELMIKEGARLAEPGEFTKRAFLNGRLDLGEAEAVLDLIRAKTDESRRIAIGQLRGRLSERIISLRGRLTQVCVFVEAYIDFPEDEIELSSKDEIIASTEAIHSELESLLKSYDEGRFFREGLGVAIVGRPNVGKSSLLNALLQKDRAIVTDMPGTTRDTIEEYLNINGLPLRIIDTAGIREANNIAEAEGVKRSLCAIEDADMIIAVVDGSEPLTEEDLEILEKTRGKNTIFTINKSDLPAVHDLLPQLAPYASRILQISAKIGDGLDELKDEIFGSCLKNWKEHKDGIIVTNLRHKILIQSAHDSLGNVLKVIKTDHQPLEITAIELRDALDRLGEIVGTVTTDVQ
ncbi:MAG: tRNA uridine-5-carboxymethylaminomethyl(34) synthesis GTPase MnmE [Nitrospirae bacterium]|nr:tRNA uridine-5-carboxymethylaminomethyl(34) synthesis GTPase MnmE [Nitrospirota bacterium]